MTAPSRAPRPVDAPALSRLVFGEHALDLATDELRFRGEPVDLEPQPAKVLRQLALHSGDIVPREDLHRLLWGEDTHVEADQGLNYCIKELRRALGDDARNPTFIETLTRRGYRFLPPVELRGPAEAAASVGAPDDAARSASGSRGTLLAAVPPAAPSPRPRRRARWRPRSRATVASAVAALTVLGVLAVLTVVAVVETARHADRGVGRADPVSPDASGVAVAAAGPPRIAVLLFDTAEDAEADRAVARSLASQLVSALVEATGPGFEVIGSTTSFAYQGAGKTIGQIGRELRAAYVVEGAFHRGGGSGADPASGAPAGGDQARLCVRLVDTREEVVVWTGSFTSGPDRLDDLPRAASGEIAAALRSST